MDLMGILLLIIGLVAGFFIGFLYKKNNASLPNEENNSDTLIIEIAA